MAYEKDPVCGMPVDPTTASALQQHAGATFYFCSQFCAARFKAQPTLYATTAHPSLSSTSTVSLAYFSMEIALAGDIPTYSGGLGVLAGDMLRSLSDLHVAAVAVSLVHHEGYFRQALTPDGTQHEEPNTWEPSRRCTRLPHVVRVDVAGRSLAVGAWQFDVRTHEGLAIPVLLLDTDLAENSPEDRHITDRLYGGDARYRLSQEIVLGVGGARMLQAAGYTGTRKVHLNEGHAAFAALELLRVQHSNPEQNAWNFDAIRERCVFTTHTPIAAGHDRFDWALVNELYGEQVPPEVFHMLGGSDNLNMTSLALNLSGFFNGVANKHRDVTQQMFPGYQVQGVTNGVHSETWTCGELAELYDQHVPGWRSDPAALRNALSIPPDALSNAHRSAKQRLLHAIARRTGQELSIDRLTLGFARRVTAYKRTNLSLSDLGRLREIAAKQPLQLVFAGKAHPHDEPGKEMIRRVFAAAGRLGADVPVVYLEDYDVELAKLLVAGSDVWVNTPQPPLEASGTSGMKAAHNGVPSVSTLDGWWLEGHVEGVTGWSIGSRDPRHGDDPQRDAAEFYDKLEREIAPKFYSDRAGWTNIMQHAIALNGSFFNTHRMVHQYRLRAYS